MRKFVYLIHTHIPHLKSNMQIQTQIRSIFISINIHIYQYSYLSIFISINIHIYQYSYLSIFISINIYIYQYSYLSIFILINIHIYQYSCHWTTRLYTPQRHTLSQSDNKTVTLKHLYCKSIQQNKHIRHELGLSDLRFLC